VPVPYTVQVRLDGERLSASITEIWNWLDEQQVERPMFRYRMTAAEDVALRLDFKTLNDAAAFSEAFHGAVLGLAPS
jgi:hypothetical protein